MHDRVPMSAQPARPADIDWNFWRTVALLLVVILALWARDARSQPWESVGPDRVGAEPVTHPTDSDVAFIYAYGQMHRTADSGMTWTEVDRPDVSALALNLIFHPEYPDLIYASGNYTTFDARFRSTDGGQSFHLFNLAIDGMFNIADFVPALVLHPVDGSTMLAHIGDQLTFSHDGGNTAPEPWDFVHDGGDLYDDSITDIAFDPHSPDRLIATVRYEERPDVAQYGTLESVDGGHTWHVLTTTGPNRELVFHPTIPDVVFGQAVNRGDDLNRGYVSEDGGQSWSPLDGPWSSEHARAQVHPDGTVDVIAPRGIWRSDDLETWQHAVQTEITALAPWHDRPPQVAVFAGTYPKALFGAGDGTLFTLGSGSSSQLTGVPTDGQPGYWTESYVDYGQLALSDDGLTIVARASRSIRISRDGGQVWHPLLFAGDGYFAIHTGQPDRMAFCRPLVQEQGGEFGVPLQVSHDGGQSWEPWGDYEGWPAFEPVNDGRVVLLSEEGDGWLLDIFDASGNLLFTSQGQGSVTTGPVFDRDRPGVVYVLNSQGVDMVSLDAGTVTHILDDHATDLVFSPVTSDAVLRVDDTWHYYSDDLLTYVHPVNAPVNAPVHTAMVFDYAGANLVAVNANDVQFSLNRGLTWVPSGPMPDVPQSNGLLEINPLHQVVLGGRQGLWMTEEVVSVEDDTRQTATPLPTSLSMSAAYPNPFNAATTVQLELPVAGTVRVELVNLLGQRVRLVEDGDRNAGVHTIAVSAEGVASGTYLLRATGPGGEVVVQRVTLVR